VSVAARVTTPLEDANYKAAVAAAIEVPVGREVDELEVAPRVHGREKVPLVSAPTKDEMCYCPDKMTRRSHRPATSREAWCG
jgi:hypothetical protein